MSGVGFLARAVVVFAALYAIGFGFFVTQVPQAADLDGVPPHADAIVALTGGGGRLGPAVALLEMGTGQRLLITGVNPATKKAELRALLKGGSNFDCCADLGFEATDTIGNAREAAIWAHDHHYNSLIVVTTDHHMPRSLLEFSAQMPDIALVPYPVASAKPGADWRDRLPRLNGEFVKYVASSLRLAVFGLVNGAERQAAS